LELVAVILAGDLTQMQAELKKYDPNHLNLGLRFGGLKDSLAMDDRPWIKSDQNILDIGVNLM
jgi:hypothetical protein